jgi:Asp-tRNA(Asn)/Glu-tRNA(Gln) amidotransferase A subunit family amidase
MGHSAKGPIGVQLVAARFREDILLAAGRDLEAMAGLPPLALMG